MKKVEAEAVEKKAVPVMEENGFLPKGVFAYVNCADCRHGSWDPRKEMVWCGKDREWVSGSSGCSRGESK